MAAQTNKSILITPGSYSGLSTSVSQIDLKWYESGIGTFVFTPNAEDLRSTIYNWQQNSEPVILLGGIGTLNNQRKFVGPYQDYVGSFTGISSFPLIQFFPISGKIVSDTITVAGIASFAQIVSVGLSTFSSLNLSGPFYDRNFSPGTAGQILSSTTNGVEWIPASSGSVGGSISSNQIAFGSSANNIQGISTFVFRNGSVGIGLTNPRGSLETTDEIYVDNIYIGAGNSFTNTIIGFGATNYNPVTQQFLDQTTIIGRNVNSGSLGGNITPGIFMGDSANSNNTTSGQQYPGIIIGNSANSNNSSNKQDSSGDIVIGHGARSYIFNDDSDSGGSVVIGHKAYSGTPQANRQDFGDVVIIGNQASYEAEHAESVVIGAGAGIGSATVSGSNSSVIIGAYAGGYTNGVGNILIGVGANSGFSPTNPFTGSRNVAIGNGVGVTNGNYQIAIGIFEFTRTARSNAGAWGGITNATRTDLGIGTLNPLSRFHIETLDAANAGFYLAGQASQTANLFRIDRTINGNPYLVINGIGSVGIYTSIPTQAFDVLGNVRFRGNIFDSSNVSGSANQILTSTSSGILWTSASSIGIVTGINGVANYLAKFGNPNSLTTSNIIDNGSVITIGLGMSVSGFSSSFGFYGPGTNLTNLNASNLASGTVPTARVSGSYSGITSVGNLTNLNVIGIASATGYTGDGANLTNLNATNLATGTVPTARVSGSYSGITSVGTLDQLRVTGFSTVSSLFVSGVVYDSTNNSGFANSVLTSTGSGILWAAPSAGGGGGGTIGGSISVTQIAFGASPNNIQGVGTFVLKNGFLGVNTDDPLTNLEVFGNARISGLTTSGGFTGPGTNLTNLDASNLASGIVTSARVSGNYSGITSVGNLTQLNVIGVASATQINVNPEFGQLLTYQDGSLMLRPPTVLEAFTTFGISSNGADTGGYTDISALVNNGVTTLLSTSAFSRLYLGWVNFLPRELRAYSSSGNVGLGGTCQWQIWNGSGWANITGTNLVSNDTSITVPTTTTSQTTINGVSAYWIRATAVTTYTTPPRMRLIRQSSASNLPTNANPSMYLNGIFIAPSSTDQTTMNTIVGSGNGATALFSGITYGGGEQSIMQIYTANVGGAVFSILGDGSISASAADNTFRNLTLAGGPSNQNAVLTLTNGSKSQASWLNSGVMFRSQAGTRTNSSAAGTYPRAVFHSFGIQTLAAANPGTFTTDAANVYIENSIQQGANQTITNSWALWIAGGNTRLDGNLTAGFTTSTGFFGPGTNLTNLNASNLASGTVPSASVSGTYSGITSVGTLDQLRVTGFSTVGSLFVSGALYDSVNNAGFANSVLTSTGSGLLWAPPSAGGGGGGTIGGSISANQIAFGASPNNIQGVGTFVFRNGSLGIGTTTPRGSLETTDEIYVDGIYIGAGNSFTNTIIGFGATNYDNSTLQFVDKSTIIGRGVNSGSILLSQGVFIGDYAYSNNLNLTGGIEEVVIGNNAKSNNNQFAFLNGGDVVIGSDAYSNNDPQGGDSGGSVVIGNYAYSGDPLNKTPGTLLNTVVIGDEAARYKAHNLSVVIGASAGLGSFTSFLTGNERNVIIGYAAGQYFGDGSGNTIIGSGANNYYSAADIFYGSDNIAIGAGVGVTGEGAFNQIAIGINIKTARSNAGAWGGAANATRTDLGIGTLNPLARLHVETLNAANAGFYLAGQPSQTANLLEIDRTTNSSPYFVITGIGSVGIYTSVPTQALDVAGGVRFRERLLDVNNTSGSTGQILASIGTGILWTSVVSIGLVTAFGGLTNYVAKFGNSNSLTTSSIIDNGSVITMGVGMSVSGFSSSFGFYGPGTNLTNLNASTLATGTVPSARVSGTYSGITSVGNLTNLNVIGIASATGYTGDGANLTNLNATNLASGTVPTARVSGSYSGITSVGNLTQLNVIGVASATGFFGPGTNLTNLNASNLVSGTVPAAVVSGTYSGITSVGTLSQLRVNGISTLTSASISSFLLDFAGRPGLANSVLTSIGTAILWSASAGGGGGGGGTIGGSISATQVPFGASANTIQGISTFVLNNGLLGVNTDNPLSNLDVFGTFNVSGFSTNRNINISGRLYDNSIGSGVTGQLLTSTNSGIAWSTIDAIYYSLGANQIAYGIGTTTIAGASTFVYWNGNVGVGTVAPSAGLHVQAGSRFNGQIFDSNNSSGGPIGIISQVLTSTGTGVTWAPIKRSLVIPLMTAFSPTQVGIDSAVFIVPQDPINGIGIVTFNFRRVNLRVETPYAGITTINIAKSTGSGRFVGTSILQSNLNIIGASAYESSSTSFAVGYTTCSSGDKLSINFIGVNTFHQNFTVELIAQEA